MNIGNGAGFAESGERYVLQYVKGNVIKVDKTVLFDIGANVGGYALLKFFSNSEIHCFEPAKGTYETLSKNVQSPNAILNNFGISDEPTESTLYYDNKDNSGLSSLYNRQIFESAYSETVKLDTLENYCAVKEVSHIHFLKMDIEGNELNALNGAQKLIKSNVIDAIQIEFGGCNIDSRTYFRDFWNLLHENYRIYRVLLDGLYEVTEYDEILEIFTCTNYLFVNKNVAK